MCSGISVSFCGNEPSGSGTLTLTIFCRIDLIHLESAGIFSLACRKGSSLLERQGFSVFCGDGLFLYLTRVVWSVRCFWIRMLNFVVWWASKRFRIRCAACSTDCYVFFGSCFTVVMLQSPTSDSIFIKDMSLFGMIIGMFKQSALLCGVAVPAKSFCTPRAFLCHAAWGTFGRGIDLLSPMQLRLSERVSVLFAGSRDDCLCISLCGDWAVQPFCWWWFLVIVCKTETAIGELCLLGTSPMIAHPSGVLTTAAVCPLFMIAVSCKCTVMESLPMIKIVHQLLFFWGKFAANFLNSGTACRIKVENCLKYSRKNDIWSNSQ